MTVKELFYICYYLGLKPDTNILLEKNDVVQFILRSGRVTVVLQQGFRSGGVSVKEMKATMTTLGISSAGCLTKEDLIKQCQRAPNVVMDAND